MAKIYSYNVMLGTMLAFMQVMGIGYQSSVLRNVFNFNDPSTWAISPFILAITGIIIFASATGIIASYLGRSPSESYIIGIGTTLGSGGLLIISIAEFGSIVNYFYNSYPQFTFIGNILAVIFFGIIVGYSYALINWWRGNDI